MAQPFTSKSLVALFLKSCKNCANFLLINF
jgi:hypothetical protein